MMETHLLVQKLLGAAHKILPETIYETNYL
jgi:hypothetical protein